MCSPGAAGRRTGTGVSLRLNRGATAGCRCCVPGDRRVRRAGLRVRVRGRLVEVEHRRDAAVDARRRRRSTRPASGWRRPSVSAARRAGQRDRSWWLPASRRRRAQAQDVEHGEEEALLDRADGDPAAVGARVDVVVRAAGVEQVAARARRTSDPCARSPWTSPIRVAVASSTLRVDDLAAARRPRLEQRADETERQRRRAAAEVADQVERRHRALAGAAHGVQGPGHARCS